MPEGAKKEPGPWEILGLSKGASWAEVKAAYRAKAKTAHPDARPGEPAAAEEFRRIRAAYESLRQARAKKSEPRAGTNGKRAPRSSDPGAEPFDHILKKKRAEARFGRTPFRGEEREPSLVVPFVAAMIGGEHLLEVQLSPEAPPRKLRISIPAGVAEGERFRIDGRVVRVLLEPHPFLSRLEEDVLLDLPLTVSELCFGAKVKVPTVDGPVELTVPKGTKPGARLRLKGKGVGGRGAQICVVRAAMPDLLRPGVERLIEALGAADDRSPRAWDQTGSD